MQLMMKFATVSGYVARIVPVYCHYETIVRQDAFLQRQRFDAGKIALSSLRRMVTSELSIALHAVWELASDPLQVESFPALLALAEDPKVVECIIEHQAFGDRLSNPKVDLSLAYRMRDRVMKSSRFQASRNLRNRAFAHRLRETRAEIRGEKFTQPLHEDLETLFLITVWMNSYLANKISGGSRHAWFLRSLFIRRDETREMWKSFNSRIDTFRGLDTSRIVQRDIKP